MKSLDRAESGLEKNHRKQTVLMLHFRNTVNAKDRIYNFPS